MQSEPIIITLSKEHRDFITTAVDYYFRQKCLIKKISFMYDYEIDAIVPVTINGKDLYMKLFNQLNELYLNFKQNNHSKHITYRNYHKSLTKDQVSSEVVEINGKDYVFVTDKYINEDLISENMDTHNMGYTMRIYEQSKKHYDKFNHMLSARNDRNKLIEELNDVLSMYLTMNTPHFPLN